jgi:GcrA cell cycle regulator
MEGAMSWTDERVEMLKKLWADGLSASQIAGELGGITRNAVIGKVHRLGLSGRAKAPSSAGPRPRKTRAPSHVFRSIRNAIRGNTALAAQAVAAYEAAIEPEPEPLQNIIPFGQR